MSPFFKSLMRKPLVRKVVVDKSQIRGLALIQLLLIMVTLVLLVGVGYLLMVESPPSVSVQMGAAESQPVSQAVSGTVLDTSNQPQQNSQPAVVLEQSADLSAPARVLEPSRSALQMSGTTAGLDKLPDLNQSDLLFRSSLLLLAPESPLADWLISEELIRKLVVTIDNMADGKIPRKHALLLPMADKFRVSKKGLQLWLDGYNHSRYTAYVELLSSIDSQQWVDLYQRYYPLMQQAYAELGYPRKAFHDRVLMAIDRLVNSRVVARPMALEQPSVMYTFADPQLQQLSAIDKQMLRLGAANGRKLKALLIVLRAKLAKLQVN